MIWLCLGSTVVLAAELAELAARFGVTLHAFADAVPQL